MKKSPKSVSSTDKKLKKLSMEQLRLRAKQEFEAWLNSYSKELCLRLGEHFGLNVEEMVRAKVRLEG
jgi:hypothetical protein